MKSALFAIFVAIVASAADKGPLPIAALTSTEPVDFEREVRPFLNDNCLACHCETTTKGGLNLETPELMLKGGESGAGIVRGKASESLVLQAAAHLDADLVMPPRENKAKAKNLTAEQLGLLKLWIDQGAKPSAKVERVIAWQPLPGNLNAIFAVAITADGQFAACARANRLSIYHLPSGRAVWSEVAHRDQVNALAFSPDGMLLASGGYREVKLWRRAAIEGKPAQPIAGVTGKITRGDGQRFVTVEGNTAKLCSADGKVIAELRGNRHAREAVAGRERALQVEVGNVAYRNAAVQTAEKALTTAQERAKKSVAAVPAKQQDLAAKQKALADAKAANDVAAKTLASGEAELKKADANVQDAAAKAAKLATAATEALKGAAAVDATKVAADAAAALQNAARARVERDQREAQRKQAAEKIEPAGKLLADAEEAARRAEAARGVAETELQHTRAEVEKNATSVKEAKALVDLAEALRKSADDELNAARQAATAAEQTILAVAFSPDHSTVATAGDDQLIHTWSAENGAAFDVLKGHQSAVTALAFPANGELVSSAGDGSALAWNIKPEWKLERVIGTGDNKSPLADRVNALAFSRDGKFLATGSGEPSRGGEIKLWNPTDGRFVREFAKVHSDAVLALEFSTDGKFLASGAADRMARIVDLATGKPARSFEGHTHHVLGVSWSADGRTLVSAGAEGVVKVWDATTGDRKKNIDGYEKEVTAVRFLAASANLVTSSGDNKVRLVALDGKEVRVFPEVGDFMGAAAVSADGKVVVAGGHDSVLRVWNADDGVKLATFAADKR
ncbi:MAG: c-type cytochrome domain-containing protein [Chthoniobacteraceae bacterium]